MCFKLYDYIRSVYDHIRSYMRIPYMRILPYMIVIYEDSVYDSHI